MSWIKSSQERETTVPSQSKPAKTRGKTAKAPRRKKPAEAAKPPAAPPKVAKPEAIMQTALLAAAADVAKQVGAKTIFVYRDSVENVAKLKALRTKNVKLIVVVRNDKEAADAAKVATRTLHVPNVRLTRMGRVKVAVLLSFSQRLLKPGEQFVFLSGVAAGGLDTLIVMQVGEEYELLQTIDQPKIDEHVKRVVFERVLEIAVRLAKEGREGKPVGAVFVVGDSGNVRKYCDQNIINPFRGYADDEKNVLDDRISETIREFSLIDGAFIIRGNGTIVSAGTHLRPNIPGKPLPQGLGSRHAAAAAITATTHSIAITISESTGTVRVWRRGEMITSIEKAIEPGAGRPSPLMPLAGPE